MNANWILRHGTQDIEFTTFPYAFRAMLQIAAHPGGRPYKILGPPNAKGERNSYSHLEATQLARDNGLLLANGELNSREFRKLKK